PSGVAAPEDGRTPPPETERLQSPQQLPKTVTSVFILLIVQGYSWAAEPRLTTGKAETRSRAAPIGINVTVSTAASDFTGLAGNLPTSPCRSCCQPATVLALARRRIGTVSGANGWPGHAQPCFTTLNDCAVAF